MTVVSWPTSTARRTFADYYLIFLAVVLTGYALFGRGFAYIGVSPVFVGEMCLALGLIALFRTRGWASVLRLAPTLALIPFVVWGAARMLPYLSEYGVDAVRDAVVWGYCAFAVILAGLLIAEPWRLGMLLAWYRQFSRIFLPGILVVFLVYRGLGESMPRWPWANVPVIQIKEGDAMVHLSGILAFWLADVRGSVGWLWLVLMTACFAAIGVVDRAGALAFGAVAALCLLLKPYHKVIWRSVAMVLLGVIVLWMTDFRMEIPGGKGREISFDQIVMNFRSMFTDVGAEGLDSNKEWRLAWWNEIIDYTVHGQYFWTGKGFGINLADDDGFQVNSDKSLRSPHSIHMTVLARMGVPGLIFWAIANLVWGVSVAAAWLHSRRYEERKWGGVFLFLFAFWLAFLINGSFDVFLEGPMGGIWFWCVCGTGIAAVWIYHHYPEALDDMDEDDADEHPDRAQLLPAAGWRRPGLPLGA